MTFVMINKYYFHFNTKLKNIIIAYVGKTVCEVDILEGYRVKTQI